MVESTLVPGSASTGTEAQVALAPAYPVEALSIPTLIVQVRADGLIRIEYFAQNWPNTYGLILYNSTSINWEGGANITLLFTSFGPPSDINPALAPRPNGNLTILIGGNVAVFKYPISWASLGELYFYGLRGSTFSGGSLTVTVQGLSKG